MSLRTKLNKALAVISVALFSLLVLVVMWQVFTRQVLRDPSGWTTTVAQYLFIWLVLFSVAMVFGERGHVAVDVLVDHLPAPLRRLARLLVHGAILAFALLGLVWGGMRAVRISWDQAIPGLPVDVGQMYLSMPIAGAIIAVFAVMDVIDTVRGTEPLQSPPDAEQRALLADAARAEQAPDPGGVGDASTTTPTPSRRERKA